jgi:hypothetical protein
MTRNEALERISTPEFDEHFLECEFEYVAHKLGMTVDELRKIFLGENKNPGDYKNKSFLINIGSASMRLLGLEKRLYK